MWTKLVGVEKALIVAGVAAWALFSLFAAPQFGSTDTYLFRDAAYNLLHGSGFATASFEHSHSFHALLYSSYTPLTQWLFLPFAAALHGSTGAPTFYNFVISLIAGIAVLWLLIKRMNPGGRRLFAILLLIITLPAGYLGTEGERPEAITFLLLLILSFCLRPVNTMARIVACGIIGGLAFLAEPMGGVLAAFLIGGAILLPLLASRTANYRRAAALSAVAAIAFLAPVVALVLCFQHQDSRSVARFVHQATVGGLSRAEGGPGHSYQAGDMASNSDRRDVAKEGSGKYSGALRFFISLGPLGAGQELAAFLTALVWLALLLALRGSLAEKTSLFSLGLVLFVGVFAVFPLQGNYLILSRCLFPFLLLADWAGCRKALCNEKFIEALTILNLLLLLPGVAIMTLQRAESRGSFLQARQQVIFLSNYLAAHGAENGTALVPATQYYLYKAKVSNLFNPGYLSSQHDMRQVVSVVNCDTATKFVKPGEMPLPDGVDASQFQLIAPGGDAVAVTFFGHKLMSRNWTWTCDLYAARAIAK